MKLNTNSNAYIIIYSAIMVVIVAFLLAFVYQALKPMQDANVALDVKKQILYSLNIRDLDGSAAEAKYSEVVKNETEKDGQKLYECQIDGKNIVVASLKGMGSQLKPAIVMGLAVTVITAFANVIISIIRNTIPNRIRIVVQLVVVYPFCIFLCDVGGAQTHKAIWHQFRRLGRYSVTLYHTKYNLSTSHHIYGNDNNFWLHFYFLIYHI